jgi:hypothetical protein
VWPFLDLEVVPQATNRSQRDIAADNCSLVDAVFDALEASIVDARLNESLTCQWAEGRRSTLPQDRAVDSRSLRQPNERKRDAIAEQIEHPLATMSRASWRALGCLEVAKRWIREKSWTATLADSQRGARVPAKSRDATVATSSSVGRNVCIEMSRARNLKYDTLLGAIAASPRDETKSEQSRPGCSRARRAARRSPCPRDSS